MIFRMKLIRFIITSIILIFGNCITLAQTSSTKVDGKVIFVNPIPMPLGRYVQFADSSSAFTIQRYLASEELTLQATFIIKFQINRHIPELELMSFHAESLGKDKFYMKFKKDQNAVEKLSNAIADTRVSEVTVPWSNIGKGNMDTICKRVTGQMMRFTDSSIYRRVPQSNVRLVGFGSKSIILTEPASLKFYSEDGLSRLHFTIDIPYSDISKNYGNETAVYPSYAIVSTTNNSFRAVLKTPQNWQGVTQFFFGDFSITPRDMDTLLTDDILITVYNRKEN